VGNNEENWGEINMLTQTKAPIQTSKETTMAFNMGLQTAIYILEKAEELSDEGRRFLIHELRKQIENSEMTTELM
jgi:hypothetical protein